MFTEINITLETYSFLPLPLKNAHKSLRLIYFLWFLLLLKNKNNLFRTNSQFGAVDGFDHNF